MGVFTKKITPKAGEVGIVTGFLIGMVRFITQIAPVKNALDASSLQRGLGWFWDTNWLIFEICLLILTIIVMIIVSLFTKQASEEKLKGITYLTQSKEERQETRRSWNKWDVIASLGVVALITVFYVLFW
jgi:SSS family solute:Na+ symporter